MDNLSDRVRQALTHYAIQAREYEELRTKWEAAAKAEQALATELRHLSLSMEEASRDLVRAARESAPDSTEE